MLSKLLCTYERQDITPKREREREWAKAEEYLDLNDTWHLALTAHSTVE